MYGFNYEDRYKSKPLRPVEWLSIGFVVGVAVSSVIYIYLF